MPALRIYLLGGLRVFHGEAPLAPFPTHKTRALFAYLVTFRQRAHPRETLAQVFWAGMPAPQAARNLNTALWRLRRTIPPGYIQTHGDSLVFAPDSACWLDVAAFEEALQQAGRPLRGEQDPSWVPQQALEPLHRAVDLYRGDLLEGFDELWYLVEAERLRSLYLQALHGLSACYRARGEPERALAFALRLLEVDPLRENAHRMAMELYVALGRPAEALAQFERCCELLQTELGVSPLPETLAVYESIRTAGRSAPSAPLPAPFRPTPLARTPFDNLGRVPLVGREEERAALVARIEAAGRGQGGMLLVEGEAGVGKTRLVQEASTHAETRGWLVLRGACFELREPPPYQGWVTALRSALPRLGLQDLGQVPAPWLAEVALLLPELEHLFPGLPPPATLPLPQRQEQLQQALRHLLTGLAGQRPILVVLEDLQWADGATLEALSTLVPQFCGLPVLVFGTVRSEEITSRLQEACRRLEVTPHWQRLALARLSPDTTGRLAGQVLGGPGLAPLLTAQLHRETQGNPFFVFEVLKELYEENRLVRDPSGLWILAGTGGPEEVEWPVPRGIRQTVQRRLRWLDGRSRQLLEMAAVLGSEVAPELLWQVSGWDEDAFLEASDELLRRQLLVETGEMLCFVHEQVRQVIYRGIDRAQRRDLHRLAGKTLSQNSPERVEELAQHFYRGQQPEQALPYCLQAGERAFSVYAAATALSYFGQVVSAARKIGRAATRPALLRAHEQRGQIFEHLGEYGKAVAEYRAMLTVAREIGDAIAVVRAVRLSGWVRGYRQENWEAGLREAHRAYDLAAAAGDPNEQAAALRDIGAYESMRGEYRASLEAHRTALAFARQAGDIVEEANILQYVAVTHLFLSQNDEALEVFHQALAIRQQLGDTRVASKIRGNIGLVHINRGEFAAAEQFLRQAERGFREVGARPALPLIWVGLASVLHDRGECTESLALLDQALEVESAVGGSCYMEALIRLHHGCIQWDLGQLGAGLGQVRASLDLARQSNTPTLVVGCLNALGRRLCMLGATAEAQECHRQGLALAGQVAFQGGRAENLVGLGQAALASGQLPAGRQHLLAAVRLARSQGPRVLGEALVALAAATLAEWRLKPARALAARALALAEQMDFRPLQIQALILLGQALVGQEHFAEAESFLRRALAAADPPGYPLLRWELLLTLGHLLAEAGRTIEAAHLHDEARRTVEEILVHLDDPSLREAFCGQRGVRGLLDQVENAPVEPGQIRRSLARLGAPTGRPLHAEEQVTVLWTIAAETQDPDRVTARRQHLLGLVNEARAQGGDPNEDDLAVALGVTARTVRSDVAALRAAGHAVRTRGTRRRGH